MRPALDQWLGQHYEECTWQGICSAEVHTGSQGCCGLETDAEFVLAFAAAAVGFGLAVRVAFLRSPLEGHLK